MKKYYLYRLYDGSQLIGEYNDMSLVYDKCTEMDFDKFNWEPSLKGLESIDSKRWVRIKNWKYKN